MSNVIRGDVNLTKVNGEMFKEVAKKYCEKEKMKYKAEQHGFEIRGNGSYNFTRMKWEKDGTKPKWEADSMHKAESEKHIGNVTTQYTAELAKKVLRKHGFSVEGFSLKTDDKGETTFCITAGGM